MDGVINLRGRVILVINLGTKLGMQRKKHDKNARIIVVEVFGKIMRI
jgi:purine-binding chemotaxis protein CheW